MVARHNSQEVLEVPRRAFSSADPANHNLHQSRFA